MITPTHAVKARPVVCWHEQPKCCNMCDHKFTAGDKFYDARTRFGSWALLCEACFLEIAVGLGVGRGQRYDWSTCEKEEG